MRQVALNVNGVDVSATVEPRTHLADFLRETQNLTGTHLGCEHGVCGACTILIDGEPARSCITFAASCDGADITTIEGLDQDEIAALLREAFKQEHGLQCGFCTPGMIVSARDIVLRMKDPTEQDIRIAMSGNLCRCTGYVGITKAIRSVISMRRSNGAAVASLRDVRPLGPVGCRAKAMPAESPERKVVVKAASASVSRYTDIAVFNDPAWKPQTSFRRTITVAYPVDVVWEFFGRVGDVAKCLPGAALDGEPVDGRVNGKIGVKVGPISAAFGGTAVVTRDELQKSGAIAGSGKDARSNSETRGLITYALKPGATAHETIIDVLIGFTLTGVLAQFSRSGLVQDVANRLIAAFVQNLESRLSHPGTVMETTGTATSFDAGSLIGSILKDRFKAALTFFLGRKR